MKNKLRIFKVLVLGGVIALTMSISAFAAEGDPYADDKGLQDTFKVYEENAGNGMLLSPNPNADEAATEDTNIDDIMEVYEENEGNGMLLSPNPNANEVATEDTTNEGFFGAIGAFFSKIFEWFAGLFS